MLTLIFKDFKMMFGGTSTNKVSKFLSFLFTIIIGIVFIVIEVFLFQAIFNKIKTIQDAASSYFALFLFVINVLLTVLGVFTAKKLFFNEEDNLRLQSLPISNGQIVLSKLFFMFFMMYGVNLVFSLPLFITFGIIFSRPMIFYFIALLYPLILFFFQAGVGLILVYPFKLFLDFLKKHLVIQFILVSIVAFGLTFIYAQALNLFISLIADNDISSLFTVDTIASVNAIAKFMVPINYLVDLLVFHSTRVLLPAILFPLGVFIIGVVIVTYFYNRFLQAIFTDATGKKKESLKVSSPVKALIKKEFIILFRNSNFLFSFTGLLMVEPFLSYLVIKAMNTIFSSGSMAYYVMVIPNMAAFLDVMLMLLISGIIYSGANNYITNENKNVRLMKSVPVSLFKQLAIKVMIPLLLSLVVLLISYIVLLATKTIADITFLYGLGINILFILSLSLVSLYEELHLKRSEEKNTLLTTLFTYVVPILYFVIAVVLCYYEVSVHYIFLIGLGFMAITLFPSLINFKNRVNNNFLSLEVSN